MKNNIFYPNQQYRELSQMPYFSYEKELELSEEAKFQMMDKVVRYLSKQGVIVSFSEYIYDPDATLPWETTNPYRYVPIAELKGREIVINARKIDFLSVFLSIGHIYGHLVQRSATPERYKGINRFLELLKPLSIKKLLKEYNEFFEAGYKNSAPKEYIGDFKHDFKCYEIEAFAYSRFVFQEAGIQLTPILERAIQNYLRTDFEELWRWASTQTRKDAPSFMNLFQELWNTSDGWENYKLGEPKAVEFEVIPAESGRLTVVRDGEKIENVYL